MGLIVAPLLLLFARHVTRVLAEVPPGRLLFTVIYFTGLGAGFLLVEIALIHRFIVYLGHPLYATSVVLGTGEEVSADAVVVATELDEARRLLGEEPAMPADWCGTSCYYYDVPEPPLSEAILALNGEGRGPISHVCVPSLAQPSYAPAGRALVSVTVVAPSRERDPALDAAVMRQLAEWFGSAVESWRPLPTARIARALPSQPAGALEPPERPSRVASGIYVCGDHRDNASIQGALRSGGRAARAILSA